jgi:hypothetical protein
MILLLVIQTLVLSATPHICFFNQVDDILEPKLDRKFKIIIDKGTLDAIRLHPDGRAKRYNCDWS